jgi:hypothetical protein
VDRERSVALFDTVAAGAIASAEADTSHRWAAVDPAALPRIGEQTAVDGDLPERAES